ncbi:thiol-disulfide oxidoreductase DCC family protein [Flexivirga sp. B27]
MRPTLLYDADCGFCTKAAGFVPRLRLRVDVDSLQSVDLAALGVSEERAFEEMPFVDADGTVVYGHEAVAAALRTGPAPARMLGRLLAFPAAGVVARPAYRWVARHRHQLPGGTPACALPATDSSITSSTASGGRP